ncbi:ATP-dependent RNA helicase ddx54 [Phlyctochytrium bullatum]|nr:ATP-dependent RNA helicase ddx54 [Phlyctochytrium bullatum]
MVEAGSDDEHENNQHVLKKGKSGGFQSMGLSHPVYTAIINRGYKVPTPIQRKAIPIILEKRDVVAMARTGSGKTAAFLIPLVERLKGHSAKFGARGLILTPSRELAFQTLKFFKEMAKNTDLRACVLIGGEALDDQFSTLAMNPDVIIATPGRLMHLIIEMNLDLKLIEYVVFDEADRLFEMGFAEQLREILHKLPESRQTLLFSATLPRLLVDFAKAGLVDPALIRLDADTKLSPDLQQYFFCIKSEDKEASLLYLLNNVIPKDEATIVFVGTKHLVEYINELAQLSGLSSTYVYGSLDQVARNSHIAKFRAGTAKILIVTDIAARGIDIPLLDNVINYDFPASSKVMVHRCGRVARAGRTGKAFSLVASDETVFEVGRRGLKSSEAKLMQERRQLYAGKIAAEKEKREKSTLKGIEARIVESSPKKDDAIPDNLFSSIITDAGPSNSGKKRKRDTTEFKDPEFYMEYQKKDHASERGYSVNGASSTTTGVDSFSERGAELALDLTGDDEESLRKKRGAMVWDKRKKKFTRETVGADNLKRIKTDSGASVPATFKSNRYVQWQKRTKVSLPRAGEEELRNLPMDVRDSASHKRKFRHNKVTLADPNSASFKRKQAALEKQARKEGKTSKDAKKMASDLAKETASARKAKAKSELRSVKDIAKMRRIKEQKRAKTGRHKKGGKRK